MRAESSRTPRSNHVTFSEDVHMAKDRVPNPNYACYFLDFPDRSCYFA